MHVLIVEFDLQGVGRAEYAAHCETLAPAFARIPGLIAKVWIVDPESNRAGGVYTWADRAACEAYLAGDLFAGAKADPALANLRSRSFEVLERPTEITRGLTVPVAAYLAAGAVAGDPCPRPHGGHAAADPRRAGDVPRRP